MADEVESDALSPGRFAAGMLLGAVIGFAIWMGTDTFVFLPAFLGLGVVFGMMFRAKRDGQDDSEPQRQ